MPFEAKEVYVQVREGVTYGAFGEHKPGTRLYVTPDALAAFPDKLERIRTPRQDIIQPNTPEQHVAKRSFMGRSIPDTARYAATSVLKLVDTGTITAEDAIALERRRVPPRVTLITELMLRVH